MNTLRRLITHVSADTRLALGFRVEPLNSGSRYRLGREIVRLCVTSDAFLALLCYRIRTALREAGVPLIPALLHRASMVIGQVSIGDPVTIEPGIYVPHGSIVVDGFTSIGSDSVLFPFTTIGLLAGDFKGPVIGRGVHVGTGAKLLGPITIGNDVRIGANAVVLCDLPSGVTAVGAPARVLT